ncbi:FRG domain-containing protein [Vibrio sp. 10N.261.55.A7]|uniref:FRG domain-containing protein n=1 Tax=Vibrio sp. 10N.261.55.A7 TaxID=1880851 RepID=UPI000C818824|nr:FRG domain-containing protein [Vibrio sp. 10N.261.55.A7]PMK03343.1 hypothetical protein BCU12_17405 [Vibrio sp. 10N.261.55.A7]
MDNDNFSGDWRLPQNKSDCAYRFVISKTLEPNGLRGTVSLFESIVDDLGREHSYWLWHKIEARVVNDVLIGKSVATTLHHENGELLSSDMVKDIINTGKIQYPKFFTFEAKQLEGALDIKWEVTYPNGFKTENSGIFSKSILPSRTTIPIQRKSWEGFKKWAFEQKDGLWFRGQASPKPLQSSFHRTGNADIVYYFDELIPVLEDHINSVSAYCYNSFSDRDLGALLNLAQHHGYPTPLLDWSLSVYVAAFFAFENRYSLSPNDDPVIFVLDERKLISDKNGRGATIRTPIPTVNSVKLANISNPRALPQQAMTMYSNVVDIEQYLLNQLGSEDIQAISIPAEERDIIMRDLKSMGINWSTLFPGLDGVCKQLKFNHFEYK